MSEPLAYFNGRYLPASQLALPVYDSGFVLGATVTEQVRSFRGQLFRLEQHLTRLRRSLEIVDIEPGLDLAQLTGIAHELANHNHRLMDDDDDLGLSLFITPGPYSTLAPPGEAGPTVCMHTYPLPFSMWAEKYVVGQTLVVPGVQQVPVECWPRELKCRSRMHYYLADRRAAAQQPGARALLLDADGCVVEASTANIVIYDEERGLLSPPRDRILPGVSLSVLEELAAGIKMPLSYGELTIDEVSAAQEAILCSTSSCVLPVVELNGSPLGRGQPGPVFRRILSAWSELAGVEIREQAERFANR